MAPPRSLRSLPAEGARPALGRPGGRPAMKLLFVADPLETFKTYKDTTFAMM